MAHVQIVFPRVPHIRRVSAHPRFRLPVLAVAGAAGVARVAKGPVMIIQIKEIPLRIIGYENVRPAVPIQIGGDDRQALAIHVAKPGPFRHVRERPVAIVVIKPRRVPCKTVRVAIPAVARPVVPAGNRMVHVKLHIICHEQVQLAVAVVVEPRRCRGPHAVIAHTGLCRYVRERSVTVVVVQNGMPVAGHIDVRVSVVVVVAHGNAEEKSAVRADSRLLRHVREGPIPVVPVERRPRRFRRMKQRCISAVHEKRVQKAVLVVVNPGNARSHRLDVQLLLARRALMMKMNSRRLRHVAKMHVKRIGRASRRRFRPPRVRLWRAAGLPPRPVLLRCRLRESRLPCGERKGTERGCAERRQKASHAAKPPCPLFSHELPNGSTCAS